MKLKLTEWASVAEIASGVAVVVTLIILIIGVNENTDVMRASAYKGYIDSLNELQASVLVDPDGLRVWDAYMGGSGAAAELDGLDRRRLGIIILNVLRIYEGAYFSNRYGVIGAEEWSRFAGMLCVHHRNVLVAGWAPRIFSGGTPLTAEFTQYMDQQCSGSSGGTLRPITDIVPTIDAGASGQN
jgi:hypothetical protein